MQNAETPVNRQERYNLVTEYNHEKKKGRKQRKVENIQ